MEVGCVCGSICRRRAEAGGNHELRNCNASAKRVAGGQVKSPPEPCIEDRILELELEKAMTALNVITMFANTSFAGRVLVLCSVS